MADRVFFCTGNICLIIDGHEYGSIMIRVSLISIPIVHFFFRASFSLSNICSSTRWRTCSTNIRSLLSRRKIIKLINWKWCFVGGGSEEVSHPLDKCLLCAGPTGRYWSSSPSSPSSPSPSSIMQMIWDAQKLQWTWTWTLLLHRQCLGRLGQIWCMLKTYFAFNLNSGFKFILMDLSKGGPKVCSRHRGECARKPLAD